MPFAGLSATCQYTLSDHIIIIIISEHTSTASILVKLTSLGSQAGNSPMNNLAVIAGVWS